LCVAWQDLAAQGYEMELRALFSLRTAEKIASYLESKKNAMEISGDKIPTTTSSAFEIPLSPQQKRLWFLAKMYPDRDSYIIRLQMNFDGQLDELKLRQSFNARFVMQAIRLQGQGLILSEWSRC
ncbi:hypothetical protein OSTOST_15571, partial [Ostertagia ostertagi]